MEQSFDFSEFPARWGPSLTALGAAVVVWVSANLAVRHGAAWTGFLVAVAGLGMLNVCASWIARAGVISMVVNRTSATNLVATRSSESWPPIWLVAHVDSKSQTIPMIVRVISAVSFTLATSLVLLGILLLGIFGPQQTVSDATSIASWCAVLTALPIICCFIGNRSSGALDNASGVASVMIAAQQLASDVEVGILITSAEELGLAGARHFTATSSRSGIAINCDTVDDAGKFVCMASGRKIARLDAAIDRAASRLGGKAVGEVRNTRRGELRLRGMIPGILADNVAFTDAGWESFTLSRGNIRTLRYVHTSRDLPGRIKGTGIATAASLIAAIVEELS